MTRLTQSELRAMALKIAQSGPLRGKGPEVIDVAEAAIIATLTEYAPDKLPRDPDEELASKLAAEWQASVGVGTTGNLALYVIKHMKGAAQ